ncbi:uncharacterized protein LOC126820357 [Patella vulgata]|uniref:uncharacterized protein LOC126820357 n=1 Tax=Patella vulgata TaxID=6465 RepID=UPI00218091C5|nr:uncharacterized protein LOC126820357 [Patella vulgata]XP_050404214.1 uncharacterized protein LOC126820357 [Patella vulgata]
MSGVKQSNPGLVILIILSTLVFAGLQVLNYLAADPANSYGLFEHGIANVSAMYPLDVTPAGVTFAIWGVIYAWQALILIYSLTSLCRQTTEGPVYSNPTLLPPAFFIAYIANNVSNITWLFLWDRLYLVASSIFLFLIAFTLYVCMIISYVVLNKNKDALVCKGRQMEIWLIIFIVQNGLAIYATWTSIASLINLGTVIAYATDPPVGREIASSIALGLLTAEFVAFVSTDLSVLNKYTRYVFTPYVVLIVACVGIIAKNWDPTNPNSIFTVVILGLSLISFIAKIVRMAVGGSYFKHRIESTLQHNYEALK